MKYFKKKTNIYIKFHVKSRACKLYISNNQTFLVTNLKAKKAMPDGGTNITRTLYLTFFSPKKSNLTKKLNL